MQRAFRYSLFTLKEQTVILETKQYTTLWLNLALMRDKLMDLIKKIL